MPTESFMLEQLKSGRISLPPLAFRLVQSKPCIDELRLDAIVEATWSDLKALFAVEFRYLSTPKSFRDGMNSLASMRLPADYYPMLISSFLNEGQLNQLQEKQISGVDLCGNGVVIVPGRFSIFRSGASNRFPSSALIKNIYRRNSSLVARAFFAKREYDSVQSLLSEVNRRNLLVEMQKKQAMVLSTVSKALKSLEDDLIITRNSTIRLMQADVLLEKLAENYEKPRATQRERMKVDVDSKSLMTLITREAQRLGMPICATGRCSVGKYAVMQRGDILEVYCPKIEGIIDNLPRGSSDRFPNLELIETSDETAFFDCKQDADFVWASPVQTYLELISGDKRDQETAIQIKSNIL